MPLPVGIVVANFDVRRINRDVMAPKSEEASDGKDKGVSPALWIKRNVLDLPNVLIGVVVDVETDQVRAERIIVGNRNIFGRLI